MDAKGDSNSRDEEHVYQSELWFGSDYFPTEAVKEFQFEKHMEGNQIVASASAVVFPPSETKWDYHSRTVLTGPEGLAHSGICVKAEGKEDGSIEFSFQSNTWEFERSSIKGINVFGMPHLEIAYWLPLLTGFFSGVEMPGLVLDNSLRPFLYSVPLKGLTAKGKVRSFFVRDFGVASDENDDVFRPILDNSDLAKSEPVWGPQVPKAWGVVFARDLLEAERLALTRARFTADLISFALRTGISHFVTRYDSEAFEWDANNGKSTVSLHPWLLIFGQQDKKGWIRTIPLTEQNPEIDLEDGYERISFFAERFLEVSEPGDFQDQTGRRILSDRERKMSAGVQRSLRWLGIASSEESLSDQFIATWISLESVLNSIDYPGVFQGDRRAFRNSINQGIKTMGLPTQVESLLSISEGFVKSRVFEGNWPLRHKLAMFAMACGVELRPGDSDLIKVLARFRNEVFHSGESDPQIPREQLRQLQYLIERLIVAASVHGYEDLEEGDRHQLRFGELGPEGGAAPLFLNGRRVPYKFTVFHDKEGQQNQEFVIEGKIYCSKNAEVTFGDS